MYLKELDEWQTLRLDYLSISLKSNKFDADKATSIQGKLRTIQNLGRPKIVFPGCGMWMHVSKSLSFSIAPKSRIFASRIKTLTDNRLTPLKNCSNQCQFRLLFCLQRSVINRPRRRWVRPRRHGSPSPQPGCRPLARFPQLGSTRAPRWGSCCYCPCLRSRTGRLRPRWLVDRSLVMEALRPPPPSRQAGSQRSRRPPGWTRVCICLSSNNIVANT